jgi:cytochrome c
MIKKLSLVFLFLLSACDGGPDTRDPNPLHLPPQGFVGDSIKGREIYFKKCQVCHGNKGLGTNQGPPLVNKIYNPRHHADLAFNLAVKNGVRSHHWKFGDMKPLANVSPEEVSHIVAYVRERQRKAGVK